MGQKSPRRIFGILEALAFFELGGGVQRCSGDGQERDGTIGLSDREPPCRDCDIAKLTDVKECKRDPPLGVAGGNLADAWRLEEGRGEKDRSLGNLGGSATRKMQREAVHKGLSKQYALRENLDVGAALFCAPLWGGGEKKSATHEQETAPVSPQDTPPCGAVCVVEDAESRRWMV